MAWAIVSLIVFMIADLLNLDSAEAPVRPVQPNAIAGRHC
ncbi:hypothetical Protein YC6258_05348 [Gynuella sunshinyii YC6258]|uniref:Uncharacterized protein n=1 Tax=Gynuella sunshinyii YC6258 TaxID=1445510 RepID=A0A0C5VRW2_9GAMM|nr:hypothetical Protein YC6258_05348 [Gynuella sunshinyii YC6258]